MGKKILKIILLAITVFGLFLANIFYGQFKEHQRKAAYKENIVNTASSNVTVLRDSILIEYQNNKRTLHIYVPPNYMGDTLSRFPVIYLMDGGSAFNDLETMSPEWQVDEIINAAAEKGEPTAIVIGINQAKDRSAEYTPFKTSDNPDAHGAQFTDWLISDLKNWVDTHYRTKPDAKNTTIAGISRSGMMAYYMLMAHPDIFGNALIQSPSMWVDEDKLMEMELPNTQLNEKKIFVSVGEKEGFGMKSNARNLYKKFKSQGLNDQQLKFEIIPDEGHTNWTWRKSFALAYPWLMESEERPGK